MHCFCTGGVYKQPNMRLFSLNEQDEWTMWKNNSDYFYPEMIPEPDYSDSGDDADGSDDEEYISLGRKPRPDPEKLRDVTEVYVSHVDVKKTPGSPRRISNKQANSSRKQVSKSAIGEKVERQSRKMSPKTPSRASKPVSPKARIARSGENNKKTTVKTKLPPSKVITAAVSTIPKRSESPESTKKIPSKPKSPETVKKIPVRPKSPAKTNVSKSTTARRPKSPEGVKKASTKIKSPAVQTSTAENLKASKNEDVPSSKITTLKREAGDVQKIKTEISPLSSPTTDASASSIISTEHSSDEDLIKPRKVYQLSTEKRKLQKELKFSQRYGKLSSSKTELQLAIERFTENKEKKELETGEKTSLEKILQNQARKIEMQESTEKSPSWMDQLQRPPNALPNPKADEFYRVHARVVNSNSLTHCFLADDDQSEYLSSQTLTHTESGSDS